MPACASEQTKHTTIAEAVTGVIHCDERCRKHPLLQGSIPHQMVLQEVPSLTPSLTPSRLYSYATTNSSSSQSCSQRGSVDVRRSTLHKRQC